MPPHITIPFARPSLDEKEIEAVTRVLKSGWVTSGQEVLHFEKEFVDFLQHCPHTETNTSDTIYVFAVQSATAALHIAAESLGIGAGDVVIASPYTFVATASAMHHAGATIAFIDCAPNSIYPDASTFEKLPHSSSHKAFIAVHLTGTTQYFLEIQSIIKQRNLWLIEDAAHAFPALTDQGYLGTIGDMGIYSFYANKPITTGEGGMIICKDKAYADTIVQLRSHGMSTSAWQRFQDKPEQYQYDVVRIGYKYNMPDILAAIGRIQLRKAKTLQKNRTQLAQHYIKRLTTREYWNIPHLLSHEASHAWHLFIIHIQHPRLSRDDFMCKLQEQGVGTSVHYKPLHLMSYFKRTYGLHPLDFPNALHMFQSALSLPLYPDLTVETVDRICDIMIAIGDGT